jgi:diguanylate cyclase (GGDEF)-like protein
MSQNQRFSEDSLTGLFNRGELDRYLLARHKSRNNAKWCFILMDVDDFKQINDLYGHAVGDEALQRTAGILKTVFGTYHAFLARYGGDEFSVVLDDKSQDEVEAILLQLTEEIQRRNADANRPYRLSISCGYAFHDAELNGDISRLVESADMMMYRNKQERKKLEQGELS